jgi:soluble lytic murein transglycosylase-like protein
MKKIKFSIISVALILTILIFAILGYNKQVEKLNDITNLYDSNVSIQDGQIEDVHIRVAELTSKLNETELILNQKNKELYSKINSLDAAINSKSKRWVQIKKVRSIVKDTITTARYESYMNIVSLTRYASAVVDYSSEYDVPVPLILAVTRQESAFNPQAISHAGAQGLMQLMPGTARECATDIGKRYSNIFHVGTNVQFGTFYLRKMLTRFNENTELSVKAYNAGPNYVSKVLAKIYRNYPDETIDYSEKVLGYLKEYQASYN